MKLFSKPVTLTVQNQTPPGTLPSWVPQPGNIAVLSQANGKLANRFQSQCAPYYDPFFYIKTVNDYSTSFKNPYWGTYGATVFFGGGHAGTNDNTVTVAEYTKDSIVFKRVSDPTPWFGTGTDANTKYSNSAADANSKLNFTYMESTIDGQPGAPHSYCSGDIIGPEYGGAQYGSLLQVAAAAVNYRNDAGAIAAHQIKFDTLTLATTNGSNRKWSRVTNNTGGNFGPTSAPFYTAFVGSQKRVYVVTNGGGVPTGPIRWFDMNTNSYVLQSTTGGFGLDEADGYDSGNLFWVPSRNLLICMYPVGGQVKIQYMDVSKSNPTLGNTVTLTQPLKVDLPWSAATWCTHNNRIILAGVSGDTTAFYEIEIPTALINPWTVTRAPLGSGQSFQPADPALGIGITYKKFHYDEKVRSIVYMPRALDGGGEQVWVYRPRGT